MPAPTVATWALEAKIAAHQAVIALVDSGAGAGKIMVRNAADGLLAEIPLDNPCGSVNMTTGQLTFDIAGPDTGADQTGTVAYIEICDDDDFPYLSIPAQQGTAPVAGKAVFNIMTTTETLPVTCVSVTVG